MTDTITLDVAADQANVLRSPVGFVWLDAASGAFKSDDPMEWIQNLAQHQGYAHFYFDTEGNIYEALGWDKFARFTDGANVDTPHSNDNSMAVVFLGDGDAEWTAPASQAARRLVDLFQARYNYAAVNVTQGDITGTDVGGHGKPRTATLRGFVTGGCIPMEDDQARVDVDLGGRAREVAERVAALTDVDYLVDLYNQELEGGSRKTVLEAVEDRLDELGYEAPDPS